MRNILEVKRSVKLNIKIYFDKCKIIFSSSNKYLSVVAKGQHTEYLIIQVFKNIFIMFNILFIYLFLLILNIIKFVALKVSIPKN